MSQIEHREHKVKCHYGIDDYWKFYLETCKDPKDEKKYKEVLKDYLNTNRNYVSKFGYIYSLPKRLGRIEIRKFKKEIKIDENNKIKNNLSINWKATNELWKENEIAKKKKILIRYTNDHTKGYSFRVYYFKNSANFKNKTVYTLQVNRELRRATGPGIMNKTIDSFLLSKIR